MVDEIVEINSLFVCWPIVKKNEGFIFYLGVEFFLLFNSCRFDMDAKEKILIQRFVGMGIAFMHFTDGKINKLFLTESFITVFRKVKDKILESQLRSRGSRGKKTLFFQKKMCFLWSKGRSGKSCSCSFGFRSGFIQGFCGNAHCRHGQLQVTFHNGWQNVFGD